MKSATFVCLFAILIGTIALAQNNPVPLISLPLIPDATAPGGQQFTLTVNGTGFVSNSAVNWNGSALSTQFVNGSQLTAIVPATDIATASTAWITVVSPAPGGGTSNTAFFTVTADAGNSVAFTLASSPAAGQRPNSVAVGDFNGDGKLDLAVANYPGYGWPSTVSILLGDGTGNFTLAWSPAAGDSPESAAVGDFNGDGILDLAVANETGGVSILLGDGTGNFTLASSPAAGAEPVAVAVGDFNGDGNLDLAVADWGGCYGCGGTVSILLGDGTGNFTLASSTATDVNSDAVAVGDFNGDGKLDLAVANREGNTVSILLGDGAGNFTLVSSLAVVAEPYSVAVGDFNGDGKLDLAVANNDSGTVCVFLGDGTGNFTLASSPVVGRWPVSVAVDDFNGDGKLDLAVANEGSAAAVLLGDGTGNFTPASYMAAGGSPESVAVGDFNGDGKLDLAIANGGSNTVSILLQIAPGPPKVTLSPTSLNFGKLRVGKKSKPKSVRLINNGTGRLNISSIATNSKNFSQTNNCPSSVVPGGRCTINVTFMPDKTGALRGAVTIKDNASNSPQKVPLTGTGTR